MSVESIVQKSLVSVFKYTIVASVLAVTFQRGAGVLTRSGVGTLVITYSSGQGVDTLRTFIEGTVTGATFGVLRELGTSTDEVKQLSVMDAAGAAVDDLPGEINVSVIQGD